MFLRFPEIIIFSLSIIFVAAIIFAVTLIVKIYIKHQRAFIPPSTPEE